MNLIKEVRRAIKGNPKAFEKLIQSHQLLMYRVSRTILTRDEDCADAMQEAIMKAFQHMHTLREPRYFKTWLIRILINECYNIQRKTKHIVSMNKLPETSKDEKGFQKVEIEQLLKRSVNRSMPPMINDRVDRTLKQLPRKKRRNKLIYTLAAMSISLFLVFGLILISPVFANTMKEMPIVGSAFEMIGDWRMKKGKTSGFTTDLGEQIEIDGKTVTFTETLYDGGTLYIGYLIEGNTTNKASDLLDHLDFFIKGKGQSIMGGGSQH